MEVRFAKNVVPRWLLACAAGVGLASALPLSAAPVPKSHLDVITFAGPSLKSNPLHDPVVRRVAVFVPAQYSQGERVPVVYYLPGYGASSAGFIRRPRTWLTLTQKLADQITPMLLVVADCRTRWGGSQYLNSPAQGNYADYVCKDIVSLIQSRYATATNGLCRIIAGHSSGGFGALRLGMAHHQLFKGVIALSPDSDFPVSHLPLVELPGVTNAPLARVRLIESEKVPVPQNGDLLYALGLSAAYAPSGSRRPGHFQWLYDARGRFRRGVWRRWLANDPLTIARENPHAFAPDQAVYLDGARQDQYAANIGAGRIYQAIHHEVVHCTFYEPPGRHGQHVPARLARGLEWMFGRPIQNIPSHPGGRGKGKSPATNP